MMTKKGISPLIATVLIIGFVIVLAVAVMQWGGDLFENIKSQTEITSEVNLLCSSGLATLKVNSAILGTTLDVTIDNSNEQEIAGFLFRGHLADGTVVTKERKADTDKLAAFGVKTYNLALTDLTGIVAGDTLGAMAIVLASDGNKHTCPNEKKITVT